MLFKNQVFWFITLHLSIIIVISAGDSKILKNPSNGKLNPVHHSFDERKISKRHNEPDFQTCLDNFEIYQDKIIRTQDSRAMGARYINERDVSSREDCLRLCCETPDCDVFVFEERSPGSCYLFQCGTPEEFKCKFTKHKNYTSAVLAINRHMTELESQIKLTKHEHELTNLRQSDSSPTAIIPISNTESTILPENKETEQLVPSSPNNNSANNNRRCSRYQFECRSSEECIAIYNACDGIPQCSDGSDEAPELGCPASLTTIMPVERVNQEVPENMVPSKINVDNSLNVLTSSKHQHNHQTVQSGLEPQIRHTNKEYNSDSWIQQSPNYNEQTQAQQHHHHHQELQVEQQQKQNQQLHQQLQEHEQQEHQKQQQIQRQQELQHQQQLLQESQQQKLQEQHQQLPQTPLQQQVSTGGNYISTNGGIQSQQMLTMSSQIPQQHQQLQQMQLQTSQTENIQPPQQLINQAKLYGREGEGLLYHSPSVVDTLHWPSNNYQQEQTQENIPYRVPNAGMSQIFNHKGNSLVSQSERAGNQFADTIPNEYNRYNNYFDNSQYRMLPPHTQQTTWQNAHKPLHDMSPIDDTISGPHEGESAIQSGLNGMGPDYYYEESVRNKLQQQLLAQQRIAPQNNIPVIPGDQLVQAQFKVTNMVEIKKPVHEETTLDHVNHELQSNSQGSSVKKASAHHPSSDVITTEKPKEMIHHYGHNSHRKMEQLTAEVTLRETSFDGVTMQDGGSPSGAILSLTLGMCVTSVMIVLVGCRMRTVRRRMRRGGKSAYAHDADFLVNGMYL